MDRGGCYCKLMSSRYDNKDRCETRVARRPPDCSPSLSEMVFHPKAETIFSLLHVSGKTRTPDKYRVVYTDHQRLELEKEYQFSKYITIRRKAELAQALSLSERQVGPCPPSPWRARGHDSHRSPLSLPGQDLVPEPPRQGAEAGEEVRQTDRRGEVQRGHESAARGRGEHGRHVRDAAPRPPHGHGGGHGTHAAPLALAALNELGRDARDDRRIK